MNVAVYPWEITVRSGDDADNALNEIVAPISSMTPEGGRMRVHFGALTAECAGADVHRLGLRRGQPASVSFSPAAARLIALDGGAPAAVNGARAAQ